MSANMEDPAMAKGLGKVNPHPNPKKGSTKEHSHHQTIALISHVCRSCLKSGMLGFSIMGTKNFQMPNQVFEKEQEPEIKLPTFSGSQKKQRIPEKTIYLCFMDYPEVFDCVDHNNLWKALKEMGIPDDLTCLLRNLYAGQEATVRTLYRTTDWFKIEKGV